VGTDERSSLEQAQVKSLQFDAFSAMIVRENLQILSDYVEFCRGRLDGGFTLL